MKKIAKKIAKIVTVVKTTIARTGVIAMMMTVLSSLSPTMLLFIILFSYRKKKLCMVNNVSLFI